MRKLSTPWQVGILAIMGMYALFATKTSVQQTKNNVEAIPKTEAHYFDFLNCEGDILPPVLTPPDTAYAQCTEEEIPSFGNGTAGLLAFLAANGSASDDCQLDSTTFEVVDTTSDMGSNPETVIRTYRVADISGNYGSIGHVIVVEDTQAPDIMCKDDIAIGLSESPVYFPASYFLEMASDNCGTVDSVLVHRLDGNPTCDYPQNAFGSDSIAFCCGDVGTSVVVQVTVKDDSGNANVCMLNVLINDDVPPQKMIDLPDITISCYYEIDTADLSPFGVIETNMADVDPIVIDDPGFQTNKLNPTDGMVLENCPDRLTIEESITDNRDDCNTGELLRTFTITDGSDNSIQCVQRIFTVNTDPFTREDITWPVDTMVYDCTNIMPDPDQTGRPVFNITHQCQQPTATFEDWVFDDPNSGCPKIRREWKVLDWCTYDKMTGEGKWSYYQYIKVMDTIPPVFTNALDTLELCTPNAACAGDQSFSISATDVCSNADDLFYIYELDENNDGTIEFTGKSKAFTRYLELGEHSLTWTVDDRCGNITTLTQLVIVKECKAPTPICYKGLATSLDDSGFADTWAEDFNNKSYDNCTPVSELVFSFSSDTSDQGIVFGCEDIGRQTVQMWVTDREGNQTYCETWIDVQDNFGGCTAAGNEGETDNSGNDEDPVFLQAMIAGKIVTAYNSAIPDAQVNLSGPELETYMMTDGSGKYNFEALETRNAYEVIPTKDDNPLDGVSTLDLVLIQQHILGLKPLATPYQMIAADINNSQHISAADLVQLRKMILGVHDAFPENNSWRFVEAKYGILENENPWPFVEGMYVGDLKSDMMDNDFIGVKTGDVNGSVEEKLSRKQLESRSNNVVSIHAQDRYVDAGELVEFVLKVSDFTDMVGLQWTLTLDNEKVVYDGWTTGQLNVSEEHLAVLNGEGQHVTFAWSEINGVTVGDDRDLITIQLKVKRGGLLSEMVDFGSTITPALGYNSQEEKVTLDFAWMEAEAGELMLYQNSPNPFQDRTAIQFELPRDMNVQFYVSDVSGKMVYSKKDFFKKGKNTIFVSTNDLNGINGVVYYTMKTPTKSITKKMILLR